MTTEQKLREALTLAANRLARCALDHELFTEKYYEIAEWGEAAREALSASPANNLHTSAEPVKETAETLHDVDPVAWMYRSKKHVHCHAERADETSIFKRQPGWTETPLYAEPRTAARIRAEEAEACAAFIEANVMVETTHDDYGSYFAPRREGNRYGLEYAAAIRARHAKGGEG